jgi:hypothetical protein
VSNLDPAPEAIALMPGESVVSPGIHRAVDVLEARKTAIGDGTEVRRLLPQRTLRTVGAWCFLDHYGPDDVSIGPGMQAGRFGEVHGYPGEPLAAPPLPSVPLKPR